MDLMSIYNRKTKVKKYDAWGVVLCVEEVNRTIDSWVWMVVVSVRSPRWTCNPVIIR